MEVEVAFYCRQSPIPPGHPACCISAWVSRSDLDNCLPCLFALHLAWQRRPYSSALGQRQIPSRTLPLSTYYLLILSIRMLAGSHMICKMYACVYGGLRYVEDRHDGNSSLSLGAGGCVASTLALGGSCSFSVATWRARGQVLWQCPLPQGATMLNQLQLEVEMPAT